MRNLDVVADLKPKLLWHHFAKISEIPRCSKNEEAVMNYIRNFAIEKKLEYREDKAGNIVICKNATPGFENFPGVVLQGHTDMVCEKNKNNPHDFSKDPIQLIQEDGFIRANDTTLGADNAIGFCAALAVLEDDSLEHGPIEALFTIDEETGLTGAFDLDPEILKHRIMLNMDSEEDGEIYVGCSGGKDTKGIFSKEFDNFPAGRNTYKLIVNGLKGGHSGLDIQLGLGNAIRFLGRILYELYESGEMRIAEIEGGSKRNAIPREAEALIVLDDGLKKNIESIIDKWQQILTEEFGLVEPNLSVLIEKSALPENVFSRRFTKILIDSILAVPHGVQAMSHSIEGLVETSTNLATLEDNGDNIVLGTSQRSSNATAIEAISLQVQVILNRLGAQIEVGDAYPGWQPNLDSKILQVASQAMEKLSGKKPEVKAIHAGLECGIIGEKFPGIDMVSFGPTIMGAHSPEEKVDIAAVERFWEYLLEMLKNANKAA